MFRRNRMIIGFRYGKTAALAMTLPLGVFAGRFGSGAAGSTNPPQSRPPLAGRGLRPRSNVR
jgi:hypothetical protein